MKRTLIKLPKYWRRYNKRVGGARFIRTCHSLRFDSDRATPWKSRRPFMEIQPHNIFNY